MLEIVVFAESQSDQRDICGIADRILLAHSPDDWDERENVASPELARCRSWVGLDDGETFFDLHRYKERAGRNPRHFARRPDGESGGYDYALIRIALQLCVEAAAKRPEIRGLFLIRDMDAQAEARTTSAEDAKAAGSDEFTMIFARPDPCKEAWLLHGFIAKGRAEENRLTEAKKELHFDPTTEADRLRATNEGELRNSKRVLKFLTADADARRDECWEKTPLRKLWERGARTGLSTFCEQIETVLLPAIPELKRCERAGLYKK